MKKVNAVPVKTSTAVFPDEYPAYNTKSMLEKKKNYLSVFSCVKSLKM